MSRPLNEIMEFDHPIRVHPDGSITDAEPGVYAPSVYWSGGEVIPPEDGWSLLSGYTGQYGYNGPVMHPSEFIGGGMESDIRETPGVYVAVIVEDLDTDPDADEVDDAVGWAVAFRADNGSVTGR